MATIDPARVASLSEGSMTWSNASSTFAALDITEGGFAFNDLTVGLVLSNQPDHWARYGDTRTRKLPLMLGDAWVFAAGMDGHCQWREKQRFLNLSICSKVFESSGLPVPGESAHRVGPADPLVAELMLNLHTAPDTAPQLYRESLTLALATHLASSQPVAEANGQSDIRLRRALAYLEEKLVEDVSLDDLAAAAAMSPFHFSRVFKQETGRSPHKYIIHRRMERAREMLAAGQKTVADVAWSVGYQDVSRFCELFKRQWGVTPGAYRAG